MQSPLLTPTARISTDRHLEQHQKMHLKLGLSNEVARPSKCHRGVLSVKCLGYEGIF